MRKENVTLLIGTTYELFEYIKDLAHESIVNDTEKQLEAISGLGVVIYTNKSKQLQKIYVNVQPRFFEYADDGLY